MIVQELNVSIVQSGLGWIAEENIITKLEPGKRKQLLGVKVPVGYRLPIEPMRETRLSLPISVDWRSNHGGHVSSVKNQGGHGTCVAFGAASVIESMGSIERDVLNDVSEADGFFCCAQDTRNEGWWPADFFAANLLRGICTEKLFPYESAFSNKDIWNGTPSCRLVPGRTRALYQYGSIVSIANPHNARMHLAVRGPLTGVFEVYEDFFYYKSGVYGRVRGEKQGLHCVAIVGYDDKEQCWICKNSWGTEWGMKGFFKIGYGQCSIDDYEKNGVTNVRVPVPELA